MSWQLSPESSHQARRVWWPLAVAIAAMVVLWILHPQEVAASDPWTYSELAHGIATRGDFGRISPFSQRLMVVLPVSWAYSLLGVSAWSTNLWPLLCTLLIVATVSFALPGDRRTQLLAMMFCALSGNLVYGAVHLFPDIVAAAFSGLAFLAFTKRKTLRRGHWQPVLGSLTAFLLLLGFLAKLTSYWCLFAMAWAALVRGRDHRDRRLLRMYYAPALAMGVAGVCAYLTFCHAAWGDAFSRLHAVERVSGDHLWIPDTRELIQRLTIEPIGFLFAQFGIFPLVLLWIRVGGEWRIYFGVGLACLWLAPTSLTGPYAPLPMQTRMIAPLLPAVLVLAAQSASWLLGAGRLRSAVKVLGFILLINGPQIANKGRKALELGLEDEAVAEVLRVELDRAGADPVVVVTQDPRSAAYLPFFFSYEPPERLSFVSYESAEMLADLSGVLLFYSNERRNRSLTKYHAFQVPERPLLGPALFDAGGVSLHRIQK